MSSSNELSLLLAKRAELDKEIKRLQSQKISCGNVEYSFREGRYAISARHPGCAGHKRYIRIGKGNTPEEAACKAEEIAGHLNEFAGMIRANNVNA